MTFLKSAVLLNTIVNCRVCHFQTFQPLSSMRANIEPTLTRLHNKGWLQSLSPNIRVGWKHLHTTNTLADFVAALNTAVKSIEGPGACTIKLITAVIYGFL